MAKKSDLSPRIEEFDVTNQDGISFHIVRNIDTGEQTVTELPAEGEEIPQPKHAEPGEEPAEPTDEDTEE